MTQPAAFRNIRYRTVDGLATYVFDFEYLPGTDEWRAYIVSQPDYRGRPSDAHSSHRLSSGNRRYVCWDRPLRTLEECRNVAGLWADATQVYIATGRFQPPPNRPRTTDVSAISRWPQAGTRLGGTVPLTPTMTTPLAPRRLPATRPAQTRPGLWARLRERIG